jgi:hypothetical protein
VSIQLPEFGKLLQVTGFISNYNSTIVTFSPEAPSAGTADIVFVYSSNPNLNASISFKFLKSWAPTILKVRPSAGHVDSISRIQVEIKVMLVFLNGCLLYNLV